MSADLFAEFGPASTSSNDTTAAVITARAHAHAPKPDHHQPPQRSNTDLSAFVGQSPATPFSQQPWMQANSQIAFSPTPSPPGMQPPPPGGAVGLGLGGVVGGGQQAGTAVHHSPTSMENEDDLWGDFETAAPAPPPSSATATCSVHMARYSDRPTRNRVIRASTLDLMSNTLFTLTPGPSPPHAPGEFKPPPTTAGPSTSAPLAAAASASSAKPKTLAARPSKLVRGPTPDVLFDAGDYAAYEVDATDEDEDEDEFGEFESASPTPAAGPLNSSSSSPQRPAQNHAKKTQNLSPAMDLLSLLDLDPTPPAPSAPPTTLAPSSSTPLPPPVSATSLASAPLAPSPRTLPSPDFGDWTKLSFGATRAASMSGSQGMGSPASSVTSARLQVTTPERSPAKAPVSGAEPTPVTAWPSGLSPADQQPKPKDGPMSAGLPSSRRAAAAATPEWYWDDPEADAKNAGPSSLPQEDFDPTEPPPTNIPPPSVILTILPEILVQASSCLFGPLAKHAANPALRERVMSDPKTLGFLSAHLAVATVAARVLAGRKLRWHRDRFLARAMAISPAGAKGMKLAPVDRSQAAREDREAADFVAAWRLDVGRLRAAVAAANTANANAAARPRHQLRVPEIADAMVVQTARMVPTAPKPCVVCGLRRDERVARVDVDVEDSFGEWWIEHWGHRTCRNFWKQNEEKMRQR